MVHDPLASAPEAVHEYGLKLSPLEELASLDGMVFAVSHKQYLAAREREALRARPRRRRRLRRQERARPVQDRPRHPLLEPVAGRGSSACAIATPHSGIAFTPAFPDFRAPSRREAGRLRPHHGGHRLRAKQGRAEVRPRRRELRPRPLVDDPAVPRVRSSRISWFRSRALALSSAVVRRRPQAEAPLASRGSASRPSCSCRSGSASSSART